MLGLTGTVLGMIGAFGTIAASETQPPPRLLAEDIQFALVTTCEGLIVAVPVLLAYAVFRNRVTTLMLEVSAAATDLIDELRGVEITPEMAAELEEAEESPAEEGKGPEQPPPPPPPA
jgi:biopolymer transport protein ExbB/TolQ